MSIRIVTDSTCDLPTSVIAENNIAVVPLYINLGDHGYLDGTELSRQEFYTQLPNLNPPPTTGAPGSELFRRTYERLAREGATEILSIHISIALSAVVNVAQTAAAEVRPFPVTVFDSRQLSLGTGWLAVTAAREGLTMPEILARLNEQIARTHVFAALDTLEFLKRSGRMNSAVAAMASLLQVKPLLRMYEGKPTAERVRTRKHAMERLIQILGEVAPLEQAALVHSNAAERAEALRQRVRDLLPPGEVPAVEITPVIGAHVGPGVVGFACISARRP